MSAPIPFKQRFWKYTEMIPFHSCWEWIGMTNDSGYGRLSVNGKKELAHRISWKIHISEIPRGLCILHKCDNRKCVNPDHLFLGTNADNIKDKVFKKRHYCGEEIIRKLTNENVIEIRSLYKMRGDAKFLADRFSVDKSIITRIISRKIWKHI